MKITSNLRGIVACALAISATTLIGCGHTDEEMAGKQREIDKLAAELKAAKNEMAQDQARNNEAQNQIERMREQLKQAGLGLEKSKEDAERLTQALGEYKKRADQLAATEAKFKELKKKLDALTSVGLKVVVRNNRMVIQLPGDILFDSGKDDLRAQGKDALAQVAAVIRNDKDLASRNFQVAGHTDNAKYTTGPFHDNWGLSLARARQVLLFLVAPATTSKDKKVEGGGLDSKKWSASGYGETDPFVGTVENQTKDEQQKNRRVEIVVQPNVEEMLNLNSIK